MESTADSCGRRSGAGLRAAGDFATTARLCCQLPADGWLVVGAFQRKGGQAEGAWSRNL
jgi:hypothetical protein